jgi:ferredoxin-2, mitochondrial
MEITHCSKNIYYLILSGSSHDLTLKFLFLANWLAVTYFLAAMFDARACRLLAICVQSHSSPLRHYCHTRAVPFLHHTRMDCNAKQLGDLSSLRTSWFSNSRIRGIHSSPGMLCTSNILRVVMMILFLQLYGMAESIDQNLELGNQALLILISTYGLRCSSRIKVHFKDSKGALLKTVEANEGDNILSIAHEYDIDLEGTWVMFVHSWHTCSTTVSGACEGSVACSTCHVILPVEYYDKLPEPEDDENDMLDMAFGLTDTSRLGCQVVMTRDLDGVTATLPSATRNMFVDGESWMVFKISSVFAYLFVQGRNPHIDLY